jgi:hypothetical protein
MFPNPNRQPFQNLIWDIQKLFSQPSHKIRASSKISRFDNRSYHHILRLKPSFSSATNTSVPHGSHSIKPAQQDNQPRPNIYALTSPLHIRRRPPISQPT